jgi:hypothetical protein
MVVATVWHLITPRWRLYDAEPHRRITWRDIAALLRYIADSMEPRARKEEQE